MKKFYILLVLLVLFLITPAHARYVIESQIDGEFEGFEIDRVYKLMNGQIWIQTDYLYQYHYSYMPQVIIYENHGRYYMNVEGIKESVEVEQLR